MEKFTNFSNYDPIVVKSFVDREIFLETCPRVILPKLHESRCQVSEQIGTAIQRRICLMQISRPGGGAQAFREVSGVYEASVCFAVVQSHLLRLK